MSMRKILEVMDSDIPAAERYIAIYLAQCFNDKTEECFPSIATIAQKSGVSVSTVQRGIRALIAHKHISRNYKVGLESHYRIHPHPGQNDLSAPVKMTGDPGQNDFLTPVNLTTPIKQIRETSPKRVSAKPAAEDSRHHAITSEIGKVYEDATGKKFAFNGRFASALKRFLSGWQGTADEFLDRYHDCLSLSSEPFAGKCRSACDPVALCQNWMAVCAEIESLRKKAPKRTSGFRNSI